jgi:hypothetical protein
LGLKIVEEALVDLKVTYGSVYDYYELNEVLGAGKFGIVKGG